jgi:hypothetical protein
MTHQDAPLIAQWMRRDLPASQALGEALAGLIANLLLDESIQAAGIEEFDQRSSAWKVAALGVTGFVPDELADDLVANPRAFPSLEILDRVRRRTNDSKLLSWTEIAEGNAGNGLNLLVLLWLQDNYDFALDRTRDLLGRGYELLHQYQLGYRLKQILFDGNGRYEDAFLSAGFKVRWQCGVEPLATDAPGTDRGRRLLAGLTAEEARTMLPGSRVVDLFQHTRPLCHFTRAQQQVLLRAMENWTDERIAEDLQIKTNAVTLRWQSIYARVTRHAPGVFIRGGGDEDLHYANQRRDLLNYLRTAPQELRPLPRRRGGRRRQADP